MTVGAALALVHHVHACGTCMLRQMHMCSMCMGAALAWLQHVHGGGICMGAACAWWRHMHECGTCIGAADACLRHCHVGALLASTNREAQRTCACYNTCMLPPGRGTLALLGASPESCPISLADGLCCNTLWCLMQFAIYTGWSLVSHGKVKWLCDGMTSIGRSPCLKWALSQVVFQTSSCLAMRNKTDCARCQCCRRDESLGGVAAQRQQFSMLISYRT